MRLPAQYRLPPREYSREFIRPNAGFTSGRFRIDTSVLFQHVFHEEWHVMRQSTAVSSELEKPVTDLPLTRGEPSRAFVWRKAAPWHTAATVLPAACIASISLMESRSSARSHKGPRTAIPSG